VFNTASNMKTTTAILVRFLVLTHPALRSQCRSSWAVHC